MKFHLVHHRLSDESPLKLLLSIGTVIKEAVLQIPFGAFNFLSGCCSHKRGFSKPSPVVETIPATSNLPAHFLPGPACKGYPVVNLYKFVMRWHTI